VVGTLRLPTDSITDAMTVDTITASNYLLLAGGTLTGGLVINNNGGLLTSTSTLGALTVSSTLNVTGATISGLSTADLSDTATLVYLASNQTFTGINSFSATSTFATTTVTSSTINNANIGNLTVNGTLALATDSITDAMVVDTITASNYLLLAGGSLTGGINIATGSNSSTLNANYLSLGNSGNLASTTILTNGSLILGANTTTFAKGLFFVDTSAGGNGNVFTSGTLNVSGVTTFIGLSNLTGGLISSASSSISGGLQVSGALNASSTFLVNGLSTLTGGFVANASSTITSGLNVSGNLSVSTTATFGSISSNFSPTTDNLYDIGSSSTQWRYGNFQGGILIADGTNTSTLSNTSLIIAQGATSNLGKFYIDSLGNVSATGSIFAYGNVTSTGILYATGGFISSASSTVGSSLNVVGILGVSSTVNLDNRIKFLSDASPVSGDYEIMRTTNGIETNIPSNKRFNIDVNGTSFFTVYHDTAVGSIAGTQMNESRAGGNLQAAILNQSNTADSHATQLLQVAGTSGGDPRTLYAVVGGGANWYTGIDNSDSDAFVFSSSTLGSANVLRLDTVTGVMTNYYGLLSLASSTFTNGLNVTGNLSASGTATFGSISSNFNPTTDNLYDIGSSSTQWRYGNFEGGIIIANGSTSSTLTNNGLNLGQTFGFNAGNISFDSFGLISTSGSLRVANNITASTTLQITATSTFFSDLVFDNTTLGRALYGLVGSDVAGGSRGFRFATTTADTNGQNPLLVITATTTGDLDYARVGIGTSTYWGQTGLRDQLTVAGRIYSTWREYRCDHMTSGITGLITIVDTNLGCGGYMYDRISDSAFTSLNQYPPATRLEAGLTTSALTTEGAAVRMFDTFAPATTSPVFETMIRLPSTAQTATQTVWAVGLIKTITPGTAFDEDDEGVFFTVSSTGQNWIANVNDQSVGAAGKRQINLGSAYASSTGSNLWRRMRIEVTSSTATFLIDGVVVAVHSGGIPSSNLAPYIGIGFLASNIGKIGINHIDISYMRLWVDDPPGGFDSVAGGDSMTAAPLTAAPLPAPPLDYANASNVGLWYPLRAGDETPQPGSLVITADNSLATSTIAVTLSNRAYQNNIVGVVTENPHIAMGGGQGDVPVAVSGRVSVLVTDENGPIKSGDYLVASTKPGYAMKAIKAGQTIGQALTDFSGIGGGKVFMMIKPTYFSGVNLDDLLFGLKIESAPSNFSKQMLAGLVGRVANFNASSTKSDLYTDRIAAGLEIITPEITVQSLKVTDIFSADKNVIFNLAGEGQILINRLSSVSSTDTTSTVVTFDSDGNLSLAGTLTVDTVKAKNIEGLDIIGSRLDNFAVDISVVTSSIENLSGRVSQNEVWIKDLQLQFVSSTENNSLDLAGTDISGGLTVGGLAVFKNGLSVDSISSIGQILNINSDVIFYGRPYLNSDSGGFAVMASGTTYVEVKFASEYLEQPVVNTSISMEATTTLATSTLSEVSDAAVELDPDTLLFSNNIQFIITNKSVKGFMIKLNQPAPTDITFSWIALAVKNPQIVWSVLAEEAIVAPVEIVPVPDIPSAPVVSSTEPAASEPVISGDTTSTVIAEPEVAPAPVIPEATEPVTPPTTTTEPTSPLAPPTAEPEVDPAPVILEATEPVVAPVPSAEPTPPPAP
ncbi:MAG: hypothetical protein Q7S66_01035, partial [bacterium]|nr:hypothetical protein [bacterium]